MEVVGREGEQADRHQCGEEAAMWFLGVGGGVHARCWKGRVKALTELEQ